MPRISEEAQDLEIIRRIREADILWEKSPDMQYPWYTSRMKDIEVGVQVTNTMLLLRFCRGNKQEFISRGIMNTDSVRKALFELREHADECYVRPRNRSLILELLEDAPTEPPPRVTPTREPMDRLIEYDRSS